MQKDTILQAIQAIQNGEIIVYPTDTQYALGAGINQNQSLHRLFALKRRPLTQPFPVAVATIKDMITIAEVPSEITKILKTFLPGPLTVILKRLPHLPEILTGGLPNIAIRIPNNPIALSLLKKTGPLTVTSANIHTHPPTATVEEIKQLFGSDVAVYLDGGRLAGQPSTIIDFTTKQPTLIREGPLQLDEILDLM